MPSGNARLPILTVLIAVTAVVAARLPSIQSEARADATPVAQLPLNLGQWKGTDQEVAADVQRALPSARILSRRYECGSGSADVTIITGSDATVLHDPHDCLTGDGWQFMTDHERAVDVGGPGTPRREGGGSIPVRDVVMMRGSTRARLWYWYSSGPRVYSSTLPARLGLFKTRLTEGRGRQAKFVRLIVVGETDSARTTVMLTDLARQIAGR
jgi:EpsI family protein